MVLKDVIQMSLIELIPTLPILIYIIITQQRNYKRLLLVEKKAEDTAIAANISVLWSKIAPFQEVVNGGLTLLMLGQDGNVVTRLRECIMGFGDKGVETYQSCLNTFMNDNKEKLKNNKHFWEHIEIVRKGIY